MIFESIARKGLIPGILMIFLICSPAVAGNKWMMEKMGQNLIKLNHEVVKKIAAAESNRHVSLKAKVVQDNGRQLIVIEDLEVSASETDTDMFQSSPAEYETYVSYQALDIPGAETLPQTPLSAGTMVMDVKDLEALMDQHPEGQVIELQKDAIDAVQWGSRKKPEQVYLFFW